MMPKKNIHRRSAKKSSKKTARKSKSKCNINNAYGWVVIVLGVSLLAVAVYSITRPEDLGPLLPSPPSNALYKQKNQPIEVRVQDLLGRMTLEEKIGQMSLVSKESLGALEDISKYYLGGVLSGAGSKPENNTAKGWLDLVNEMKNQSAQSRLGIPILYGVDANHGHSNVLGSTVFPHSIGLGASQDDALVEDIAKATAEELSATGINWSYSPSLDAPKDIRWGRVYEAFSDNPELVGKLGASYIKGTQSKLKNTSDDSYVLATAKHYLATGSMLWGESNHKTFKIDQGMIAENEQLLDKEYLPPYKAAVDAGVSSIMVGLNQWGEKRIIDSKYLLTTKLKDELGFKGFIVSDWYGVYEYANTNKYQANINTINAGLDMAMLPFDYKDFLKDVRRAVLNDEISVSRIDDAVSRILTQKFKAGLFDNGPSGIEIQSVGSLEHRKLARRAVAKSAVLLKNKSSVIPLPKRDTHILIAGSGADNVGRQSGGWTLEWQGVDGNWMPGVTSVLAGIRKVSGDDNLIEYDKNGNFDNTIIKADVGIAVVSEQPYSEGFGDNPNPKIEDADLAVIERLKESSNKVIVIILSGRPLLITDELPGWDGVIAAWLPGSEGGGIADVLFGDVKFSGKLPLPWPASLSQVPIDVDGMTKDKTRVLFDRGYGL